jgi:hypothetical protein
MSEHPYIRPLEHRIELLPTQGEALRLKWASLYITLKLVDRRPVLSLTLGPERPKFIPQGYVMRTAIVLIPTTSLIPEGTQAPMSIGEQFDRQPSMFTQDELERGAGKRITVNW